MWEQFIGWLETITFSDYKVYHYHHYERTRCKKLAEKYGGSAKLDEFMGNFVDLATVVQDSVIFPLYFYSIKDIAKSSFLNFKWRHQKAGGAQSIFWYEQWLETNDRSILDDIIRYNEDDVIATEHLHKWLNEQSAATFNISASQTIKMPLGEAAPLWCWDGTNMNAHTG